MRCGRCTTGTRSRRRRVSYPGPEVRCEVIADGVHVHPKAIEALWRPRGRTASAWSPTRSQPPGMPEGEYELGRLRVTVKGRECRLADGDPGGQRPHDGPGCRFYGPRSGRARARSCPDGSAQPRPASSASTRRKGSLRVGKDADVAVLDAEFRTVATWVGGRRVSWRTQPKPPCTEEELTRSFTNAYAPGTLPRLKARPFCLPPIRSAWSGRTGSPPRLAYVIPIGADPPLDALSRPFSRRRRSDAPSRNDPLVVPGHGREFYRWMERIRARGGRVERYCRERPLPSGG